MLDGAPEGKAGLRGETEYVRPVPDLRLGGIIIPFGGRVCSNCHHRDHQEVLCLIKEECVVVGEGCRVRACIPDLHLVELFWVGHIRYIEEESLTPLVETPPHSLVVVSLPIPMIWVAS